MKTFRKSAEALSQLLALSCLLNVVLFVALVLK